MKKSIIVFILLLSSLQGFSQASSTVRADKDSVAEDEIKKLELYLAGLIEKGDVDTYAGYLSDDYVRIAANGTLSSKEEIIGGMKKANTQVSMKPHDLNVRVYGNTAILRGRLDLETKSGDTVTKRRSMITKVFIKKDGKWYMVSLQGTAFP